MCNWIITCAGRRCILGTCVLIKIDSGARAWNPCRFWVMPEPLPRHIRGRQGNVWYPGPPLEKFKGIGPDRDHFRKLLRLLQIVPLSFMYSFLLGFFISTESGKWSWSSPVTCLFHDEDRWLMVDGRWHQRMLGTGPACCSRFCGCWGLSDRNTESLWTSL